MIFSPSFVPTRCAVRGRCKVIPLIHTDAQGGP